MEASVYVPKGTDMSVIEKEYPDLSEDEGWSDEEQAYFLGYHEPNEEDDEEWLAYDECIEFVGFCEGAIEQAECLITDWGPWAMSMLRRKNFSDLAFSAGHDKVPMALDRSGMRTSEDDPALTLDATAGQATVNCLFDQPFTFML